MGRYPRQDGRGGSVPAPRRQSVDLEGADDGLMSAYQGSRCRLRAVLQQAKNSFAFLSLRFAFTKHRFFCSIECHTHKSKLAMSEVLMTDIPVESTCIKFFTIASVFWRESRISLSDLTQKNSTNLKRIVWHIGNCISPKFTFNDISLSY